MTEPTTLQERIDAIVARYDPMFKALEAEGQQMQDDFEEPSPGGAVLTVDFDVSWNKTDIKLDIPSARMRRYDISFDLPEVRMNRKDMSFDTPSTRMVRKKVGEYPCFKGWKWYSCDIIIDVPEFFMDRQEISMDIPEVYKKRVDIAFDLPEFFMNRVEWSLHLPQFKIINVSAEVQEMEDRGKNLRAKSEQLSAAMKAEIDTVLANAFSEGSQTVVEKRNAVTAPFDAAIGQITKTIDELVAKKVDPIKVPANDGNINLRKTLEEVVAQREAALANFDASIVLSEGAFKPTHEEELA